MFGDKGGYGNLSEAEVGDQSEEDGLGEPTAEVMLSDQAEVKTTQILEAVKSIKDEAIREQIKQAFLELLSIKEHEKNEAVKLEARDSLTGLIRNMPRFVQAVEEERRAENRESRGALVFVDLNKVKEYNDTLGYEATSDIIRQFAGLAGQLRQRDVTLRYGGDEFVIFMPGANPAMVGKVVVKRIMKLLEKEPIVVEVGEGESRQKIRVDVTFCVGVAPLPRGEDLQNSDEKLDYNKIVDRLIRESSERTKAAKRVFSDHRQNVVSYIDREGKEAVASGEELFHDQQSQPTLGGDNTLGE